MQGEQARITVRYLRVDAFGHLFYGFGIIGTASLRGAGDTRSPMLILGLVSALNAVLSPLLVYGPGPFPEMGVDGIVTGTIIARISGGVLMLAALARGLSGLKLRRRELLIRGDVVARILRVGVPAAVDGAYLVRTGPLSADHQRDQSDAARRVCGPHDRHRNRSNHLSAGGRLGLCGGNGHRAVAGPQDSERAKRAGHEATLQCGLLAVAISVGFFFGAQAIYQLMHKDPAVHAAGVPAFRMDALFQIPLTLSITYLFALAARGIRGW